MRTRAHSKACWIVLVWVSATVGPAYAKTIYVSKAGNDLNDGLAWAAAKQTVQTGLNAASSGDQVWVMAGTYVEKITLKPGVALYGGLAGVEKPATFDMANRLLLTNETILDGNQAGSVVTSPPGAIATTRIDGFTIRNGSGTADPSYTYGGGIYCSSSSPTIANNTIVGNSAGYGGGGIACRSSFPIIANNTIKGNTASYSGGGIYCYSSSPTATANTITGNAASSYGGGICCTVSSSPTVADNAITGNTAGTGGGFYCSGSSPTVANSTITWNTANYGGGAYYSNSPSPKIANTIVAFNSSGGVYNTTDPGSTLRYNCVYLNTVYNYSWTPDPTGTYGNISADPLFVRPADPGPDSLWGTADDDYGDLRLQPGSPCVDAGDNTAVPADAADLDGDLNTTEPLPFDVGGRKRFADDPATEDTGAGTPPIVDMGAWEDFLVLIPDFDGDQDVDQADFAHVQACLSGRDPVPPACENANLNGDARIDRKDLALFETCASGPGIPADADCLE